MLTCIFESGRKSSMRHVVVDGIVVKDGKILLIKRANHLVQGGKYALPGGFLDRNEKTEDAVKREVKEETGYETKKLKLFNIITTPDRGEDRQNVAFIYIIEAGKKTGDADKEVQSVKWCKLNSLPKREEFAFDHFRILDLYKKFVKEKFSLPVIN